MKIRRGLGDRKTPNLKSSEVKVHNSRSRPEVGEKDCQINATLHRMVEWPDLPMEVSDQTVRPKQCSRVSPVGEGNVSRCWKSEMKLMFSRMFSSGVSICFVRLTDREKFSSTGRNRSFKKKNTDSQAVVLFRTWVLNSVNQVSWFPVRSLKSFNADGTPE